MPQFPFAVVDVFTQRPFAGNQLAIVRLPSSESMTRDQKQAIAREFNFSETVFLADEQHAPQTAAAGGSAIPRKAEIWTPFAELPFAGHPTIGTLCYIAQEESGGRSRQLALRLLAGDVPAQYDSSSRMAKAQIPHNVRVHARPVAFAEVLQTQPKLRELVQGSPEADGACPLVSIVKGMTFVLVELPTVERHLAAVAASPIPLGGAELDAGWELKILAPFFYVITSQPSDAKCRLRTRMIEPSIGEDPATGSACCTLCAFLALKRGGASATHVFELEQGVEMGRPSAIQVTVLLTETGEAVERVELAGSAVVTMRGVLDV